MGDIYDECDMCGEEDCEGPCPECGAYADCAGEEHDDDCCQLGDPHAEDGPDEDEIGL